MSGGIININPKLPSADDEYTPAQRRVLDAQLKEAAKGPYYGPFETADAALKFLRNEIRTRNRQIQNHWAIKIVLSDRAIESRNKAKQTTCFE